MLLPNHEKLQKSLTMHSLRYNTAIQVEIVTQYLTLNVMYAADVIKTNSI